MAVSYDLGNKKVQMISPDFLGMSKKHIPTSEHYDEGMFLDYTGNPATLDKPKWFGILLERTYEFVGGSKVPKPAHMVEAYFGDMHIVTKMFTEDAKNVINEGDLLTLKDGKLVKAGDKDVVAFQCVKRNTDSIEVLSVTNN